MKKIILTAAAMSLLSTSAVATENAFFVKADGGFSMFTNDKNTVTEVTTKVKATNTGFLGVGVGYHLMENVRFGLTYGHFFQPKHTHNRIGHSDGLVKDIRAAINAPGVTPTKAIVEAAARAYTGDSTKTLKHKANVSVDTMMLNGTIDVFETDGFKAFVGAGIGIARVSGKVKHHANALDALGKTLADAKSKVKNNFAFSAHLGGSYAISEGVDLELGYSYRHFGKTSAYKIAKTTHFKGHKVSSHNVDLGVRFEI